MAKKKVKLVTKNRILTVSGKRKTAIAKATIQQGTGKVTVNKKPLGIYNYFQTLSLREPLLLTQEVMNPEELNSINIIVSVSGGGSESQIDAARLAIARALVAWFKSSDLKNKFLKYDRMLLIADTRRKEARKWGDSKARAARQKSYR